MRDMLPKLFFVHFADTSFVAERDGELAGFLVGFLSQSEPDEAYVHFVGVSPDERGTGLGRELYERFFAVARDQGRRRVTCVTSPANAGSLAFHEAIGFRAWPAAGGLRRARRGSGRAHARALVGARGQRNPAVMAAATIEPPRPRARSPRVSV
jgi:GNAT superfamily N-acetyltransferase